jgi:hypothetical protein
VPFNTRSYNNLSFSNWYNGCTCPKKWVLVVVAHITVDALFVVIAVDTSQLGHTFKFALLSNV